MANDRRTLFLDGGDTADHITDICTMEDNGVIAVAASKYVKIDTVVGLGALSIFCCGASKIEIPKLQCDNLKLYAGHNGNITIHDIKVTGTCSIDIHYTSEMWLFGGSLNIIDGILHHTSFGKRRPLPVTDKVQVESGSTYDKN